MIVLAFLLGGVLFLVSRYNNVQYLRGEVRLDNGIIFASAVVDEDTTTMLNRISPTFIS